VPSKKVSVGDLDLSTKAGACAALRRIKHAADEVCPYEDERELSMVRVHRECLQDAVTRAVRDLHNRHVESLYNKTSGGC
jgi:UrcA family protein